jgi:hypothetical protein
LLTTFKELDMAIGTISWSAPIQGLDLPPIEIKGTDRAVSRIELRTDSKTRLAIICTLEDVFHEREAILVTHDIVEVLANRLTLEFSCQIGEARCDGYSFPTDQTGNRRVVGRDVFFAWAIAKATIRPSPDKLRALIPALEQPPSLKDSYLGLYRFSSGQRDPVAKFMFLYNLLLLLAGDKQAEVDNRIRAVDPAVTVTPSPHKPNVTETLFTRLRNEVGHRRKNTDPRTTAREIEQNVAGFQEIVKQVVSSV